MGTPFIYNSRWGLGLRECLEPNTMCLVLTVFKTSLLLDTHSDTCCNALFGISMTSPALGADKLLPWEGAKDRGRGGEESQTVCQSFGHTLFHASGYVRRQAHVNRKPFDMAGEGTGESVCLCASSCVCGRMPLKWIEQGGPWPSSLGFHSPPTSEREQLPSLSFILFSAGSLN